MPASQSSVRCFACDEQAGTPEAGYVALLTAWLEARGLTVRRHQAAVRGQFDHRQVDCELLFMSRSRCFVPSGGGFSELVAQMVERKGGVVIRASVGDEIFV